MRADDVSFSLLLVTQGVPQESVLGCLFFIICINNLCQNIHNASDHFYAGGTVLYCLAPSLQQALTESQLTFCNIQHNLSEPNLIL